MCGIFGIVAAPSASIEPGNVLPTLDRLFRLSESRGKESAGLAVRAVDGIHVLKRAVPATELIRSGDYAEVTRGVAGSSPACVIGHSRLVTNGSASLAENNQPVVHEGLVGIHNGIIVNDAALWGAHPELPHHGEVDTEVLLALVRARMSDGLAPALRGAFARIEGTASVALLPAELPVLVLATNCGSLYTVDSTDGRALIFASERYILEQLLERQSGLAAFDRARIRQVMPRTALLVDLTSLAVKPFSLEGAEVVEVPAAIERPLPVIDHPEAKAAPDAPPRALAATIAQTTPRGAWSQRFSQDPWADVELRRCTRCIIPETMPFVEYDAAGVCNYCRNYNPIKLRGREALEALIEPMRRTDGRPDCIVAFSGGRDSCFGLHFLKRELKLNPIAYSYDWGMLTDLGRRNQARLCGKLGVEHILVSADIRAKRENIARNVRAWLRKPDLGIIPLFMAGDKQYFWHAARLRKETGIPLMFICENLLERTDFKSGFCRIPPVSGRGHFYRLPMISQVQMTTYYLREYLANPAYFNASIFDTAFAYFSYYLLPHDFVSLFQYVPWNEDEVNATLRAEYDWELAEDTSSTWRIGDGTAAFYNFVYYTVAGFTEHDTFRSNQVREGVITRQAALDLAREGNLPRLASIEWYCQTIGLDMREVLETVWRMPRLKMPTRVAAA